MISKEDLQELLERYNRVEGEIKLLQEDKKNLLAEFRDKMSTKAFKAAVQTAKTYAKLKPEERSEYDAALDIIEEGLNLEHLD
jgi:uncharacterized protein (UPF0335 family)